MSESHPTKTWTKKDIDRMLGLLPKIEAPGFTPGQQLPPKQHRENHWTI